ncbi:MAG: precorrin-4 C(11)-methyltransferase [Hyphomicrobiales bacterium]|nr:precorrin-4 C(11)-methyltransferase [Hyphomicrobiales bacterium]
MTVHFIGAGPGAADLITVRGQQLLQSCPVCLYAGSLVSEEVLRHCPPGARLIDTAPLALDAIIDHCIAATRRGEDVARLHSGDLTVWSAMGEQIARLGQAGISFTVTPGVPAFAAAAAALGRELTVPGLAQSLVLTRTQGRATPLPPGESLEAFAATGATLALHLSIHAIASICKKLQAFYADDTPVIVVARASWPDETILRGSLTDIAGKVEAAGITRQALIFVGTSLGEGLTAESALYSVDYQRRFRSDPEAGA